MKKLIIILLLSIVGITCFSQPVTQGSSTTITVGNARTKNFFNLVLPTYRDTTSNVGGALYQNAIGIDSCGAVIFTYSDNSIWLRICSPKRWSLIGSGLNGVDTIYVERPIAVKIGTSGASLGKQVIYFLKESGLIAGGIPYSTGCRTLTMPPSIYNINYNQYTSLSTALTIDTSHATLNRTDRIVGDTFGIISVLKGTNSVLGLPPPFNPSSQLSLALISVPAGAGCIPTTGKVIYDQNLGVAGGEYDLTTVGAIAADPDNTDNPYHLTKALFIPTYVDSSQIVFTNTGLQDTVTSTSALILPTYLNNELTNPIQVEFFLNTTSVSGNTVINSYINPLDTGQYQVGVIPFTAFGFTSNYFNKIVFTFRGWDTSGAAGLYFDYIQIQKGITTFDQNRYVDSVKKVGDSMYYYKGGIAYLAGAVGGSAPTLQQVFDVETGEALLDKNDTINVASNSLFIKDNSLGLGTLNYRFDSVGASGKTSTYFQDARRILLQTQNNLSGSIVPSLEVNATSNTATIKTQAGAVLTQLTSYKDSLIIKNGTKTFLKFNEFDDGLMSLPQYGDGNFVTTPDYLLGVLNVGGTVVAVDPGSIGGGNSVYNEQFTGSTNATLTLSQNYITTTIRLYKNGVRLNLTLDYTEATANTITLIAARLAGDVYTVDFNY